ncbi:nucleoside diphosphate kinase homolog 7 [Haemaphysalis longicornis]
MSGKKYSFLAEWNDASTYSVRTFILNFFTRDSTVEMIDLKTRRVFLRRLECESCSLRDLYVGNVVALLSRHLRIVGYGDAQTATFLGPKHERAVLVVQPAGVRRLGDVWAAIEAAEATVCKALMLRLTAQDVDKYRLLSAHDVDEAGILEGPVICFQLLGERVLARIKSQLDTKDGDNLDEKGVLKNLCRISKNNRYAEKESSLFFEGRIGRHCNTAVFDKTTCCVIKPHVFKDGNVSKVLGKILNSGFEVTALEMFHLDCAKAEEFLLVYKGVVPNYTNMVQQLCCGPCLALEVRGPDPSRCALDFKELVGPADPVLARKLYPGSLRAQAGRDQHRNAVHCTDVPEDSRIEVEFFFLLEEREGHEQK